MPKKTTADSVLDVSVSSRITTPEKIALDKLIALRGETMRRQGISGQDTFGSWLRAMIRRDAEANGIDVEEGAEPTKAKKSAAPAKRSRKS